MVHHRRNWRNLIVFDCLNRAVQDPCVWLARGARHPNLECAHVHHSARTRICMWGNHHRHIHHGGLCLLTHLDGQTCPQGYGRRILWALLFGRFGHRLDGPNVGRDIHQGVSKPTDWIGIDWIFANRWPLPHAFCQATTSP